MAEPKVVSTANVAVLSDGSVRIMIVDMEMEARSESEIEKRLQEMVSGVMFLCKAARETDWTEGE